VAGINEPKKMKIMSQIIACLLFLKILDIFFAFGNCGDFESYHLPDFEG
jgi:hypothetical protein